MGVWVTGQLIATFSYGNLGALYFARLVSGAGIGPLTAVGPMSIVEIAPYEIRGVLTTWFSVVMLLSLTCASFTTYAVYLHTSSGYIQYQIVFFVPCIIIGIIFILSFFCMEESPRWLMLKGREDDAIKSLVALRGLPIDHPRVASEFHEIRTQIQEEHNKFGGGSGNSFKAVLKETFLVKANLRRVFQACISYALAQLSGANSVTTYLVSILTLMGVGGTTKRNMFLTGMYSMSKFFYTLIASFFFIDALGRRKSLFTGITIQMISDLYIGVYIKYKQSGSLAPGSSEGAIAAIYIHGFGYAVGKFTHTVCTRTALRYSIGLLVLPYVFVAELWPNNIRSFGACLTQTWHWLFFFGINKGTASMLSSMNNWGAFIFFAGWCFISLLYVWCSVPETAGLSLEQLDALFEGPFWQTNSQAKRQRQLANVIESRETESVENVDESLGKDGKGVENGTKV